ncbi:MAG: hypothetical protein ACOC1K_06915 [Nanoarchaeota archaeon]
MDLARNQIGILIVVGMIFIILIVFVSDLGANVRDTGNDEICRESILFHSMVNDVTKSLKNTGLECPASHYVIEEKTETEYYYEMYDLLKRCWYKTLGKNNKISGEFLNHKSFALVCYSFELNDNSKITSYGFKNYMRKKDSESEKFRKDTLDTDWPDYNGNEFFLEVIENEEDKEVHFESIKEIEAEKNYLVVFSSYTKFEDIGSSVDVYFYDQLIKEKEYRDEDWLLHTAIIPEEDFKELDVKMSFWDKEE